MSLASISIVGNLVRDPEQVEFPTGRKKTSFHVAVNGFDRIKKEKSTEYFKVEVWDRMSDLALNYLHKGNQVTVIGKLILDRWQDKEGKQRCTPLISAGQISLPPKPKSYSGNEGERYIPDENSDTDGHTNDGEIENLVVIDDSNPKRKQRKQQEKGDPEDEDLLEQEFSGKSIESACLPEDREEEESLVMVS